MHRTIGGTILVLLLLVASCVSPSDWRTTRVETIPVAARVDGPDASSYKVVIVAIENRTVYTANGASGPLQSQPAVACVLRTLGTFDEKTVQFVPYDEDAGFPPFFMLDIRTGEANGPLELTEGSELWAHFYEYEGSYWCFGLSSELDGAVLPIH